jgi:predicted lipid-binding transport protein (Tim44 family)
MLEPLNLILLAIAVFVLWKLRSALGTRTGFERPPAEVPLPRAEREQERDNVVRLPGTEPKSGAAPEPQVPVWQGYAQAGTPLAAGLESIASTSREFAVKPFLEGAKAAYEMVLEAFAKGDKLALKPLLAKDVAEGFAAAIDQRAKLGQEMTLRFVGVKSAKLTDARVEGTKAQIAIRFVGEMISAVTAKDGTVVEGDPRQVRDVTDDWTFERDISSRDPNWKLIATSDDAS